MTIDVLQTDNTFTITNFFKSDITVGQNVIIYYPERSDLFFPAKYLEKVENKNTYKFQLINPEKYKDKFDRLKEKFIEASKDIQKLYIDYLDYGVEDEQTIASILTMRQLITKEQTELSQRFRHLASNAELSSMEIKNNESKGYLAENSTLNRLEHARGNSTNNPKLIQKVLFRCYDLQVLYLIKHNEVINMFKLILYYLDMFMANITFFKIIISIFNVIQLDANKYTKETEQNVNEVNQHIQVNLPRKLLPDIEKQLNEQKQLINTVLAQEESQAGSSQAGGGNNSPANPQQQPVTDETKFRRKFKEYISEDDGIEPYSYSNLEELENKLIDKLAVLNIAPDTHTKYYKAYLLVRIERLNRLKLQQDTQEEIRNKASAMIDKYKGVLDSGNTSDLSSLGEIMTEYADLITSDKIQKKIKNIVHTAKNTTIKKVSNNTDNSDLQLDLKNSLATLRAKIDNQICEKGDKSCATENYTESKTVVENALKILGMNLEDIINNDVAGASAGAGGSDAGDAGGDADGSGAGAGADAGAGAGASAGVLIQLGGAGDDSSYKFVISYIAEQLLTLTDYNKDTIKVKLQDLSSEENKNKLSSEEDKKYWTNFFTKFNAILAEQERIQREKEERERERLRQEEEERERQRLAEEERERVRREEEKQAKLQEKKTEISTILKEGRIKQLYDALLVNPNKADLTQKLQDLGIQNLNQQDFLQQYQKLQTGSELTVDNIIEHLEYVTELNTKLENIDQTKFQELLVFITNKTKADLENLPDYKDLIKPLAFCWSKINIQNKVKEEFQPKFDQLFAALQESLKEKITEETLKKIFIGAFLIMIKISKLTDSISHVDYTTYQGEINNFVTGENQDIKEYIRKNINIFFEIILGAAMVFIREKPKLANTNALKVNKLNDKPYTNFTLDDYYTLLSQPDQEQQQVGGYKYEDILNVSYVNGDIFLNLGDACQKGLSSSDWANNSKKKYGPFAGVFTANYNNFDIYGHLFGRDKLLGNTQQQVSGEGGAAAAAVPAPVQTSNINIINPPGLIDDYGRKAQYENRSQNLMKKLQQGGNVVLFGFGFSGSGKTYTLLNGYRPKGTDDRESATYDPSLLELFIKDNKEGIQSVEFVEIYPLGVEKSGASGATTVNRIICGERNDSIDSKDVIKEAKFDFTEDITFENILKKTEELDKIRRANLRVLATPNNPDSSRSFLQITLNLKKADGTNSGKLIFFDMPGTENTVRIKVEFLGAETFMAIQELSTPKIQRQNSTSNDDKAQNTATQQGKHIFYKLVTLTFSKDTNQQTPLTLKLKDGKNLDDINAFYGSEKYKSNARENYYITLFKDALIQVASLGTILGITLANTYFQKISNITQNLILFFNKRPEISIQEFLINCAGLEEKPTLYFLTQEIKLKIVKNFMNKVLFKNPLIEYVDTKNNNLQIIDNDLTNIKIIFDLEGFDDKYNSIKNSSKDQTFDFNDQDFTILETYNQMITTQGTKYIKFKDDKVQPMLKYLIKFINISLFNSKSLSFEKFISALVFVIFQYVNFIVKQGSAIVTTLEHLKFFFLSNTDNIPNYNNVNRSNHSSFECKKEDCKCLLKDPKIFYKTTDISVASSVAAEPPGGAAAAAAVPAQVKVESFQLQEQINQGEMKKYELLSILQKLAGNESNLDMIHTFKQQVGEKYTLDLFKVKDGLATGGGGKGSTKTTPPTSVVPATKPILKNSLFVMFANIKIFRDDDTDVMSIDNPKLENSLKLLCPAELDTLEFAQSISSTTQTSRDNPAPVPKSGGGKYKIEKFKMKNLMRTLHRPKTHKSSTLKKNKLAHTHSNNPIKTKYQHYKLDSTIFKRKSKKNT